MCPALAADDVGLFGISYDTVAVLSAFAETHGIGYWLLSDEDSAVMRKLGLINERVQDDHAVHGIAPSPRDVNLRYPGVFVLDEKGMITHKRFHESYRESDTGSGFIAETIEDPQLAHFEGRVSDSFEGQWTIKAAIDSGVPVHVLSAALYERFASRGEATFADKMPSAMRYEFGGHREKSARP